jgi:hypothetical protein
MPQRSAAARPAPQLLPAGWFSRTDAAPEARFPAADNDATVKELALAWALNNDAQELGRAWLVSRFANDLARPLWGRLSVALAGADQELGRPVARHARRQIGDDRSHALGIGASALRSLLGASQLGGGDHLQRFRDLLRGFHALDPIAHLLEAGHLLETPPFL